MRRQIILLLVLAGLLFGRLDSAEWENISNSATPSEDVSIAFNQAGEIGAVWVEKYANGNEWVNFAIRRNGDWSAPEVIHGQSRTSAHPRIAQGVGDGFVAVWHDTASQCIKFSKYTGSWTTPVTVSPIGGYDLGWPSVTTTSNGRIAVAWMCGNPMFAEIFVTIYGNGWSSPVNVSRTYYASKYCDLASGPNGEIIVVWQDNLYTPSTGVDIFRTMMTSDQGSGKWTNSFDINNIQDWFFRPVVAVNSENDILSCWYYIQRASYYATCRRAGAWESPQVVSDIGDHHDHDSYLSDVCAYGNGFLYIYRDVGRNIIYTIVQDGDVGKPVALTDSSQCYRPSIDYNSSVGAAAAWTDFSKSNDVFVAVFNPQKATPIESILPPVNVETDYWKISLLADAMKTDLVVNRTLFTVQYFNQITWEYNNHWSNMGIGLAKYRIYRNPQASDSWEMLAEVGASRRLYVDKDGVDKEDRFNYRVLGVDDLGNEFYAFNRISWEANPENAEKNVNVKNYKIYRKLSREPSTSYRLWQTTGAVTFSLEDRSTEIRQETAYDYAVSSVSDKNKESAKVPARKVASQTLKMRLLKDKGRLRFP